MMQHQVGGERQYHADLPGAMCCDVDDVVDCRGFFLATTEEMTSENMIVSLNGEVGQAQCELEHCTRQTPLSRLYA